MKLDINIKNFGKIKDAEINIRPFTVISGPNSSGKSFITKALYSVFHELNTEITLNSLQSEADDISAILSLIQKKLIRPSQQDHLIIDRLMNICLDIKETLQSIPSIKLSDEILLEAILAPLFEQLTITSENFIYTIIDKPTKYSSIAKEIESLKPKISFLKNFPKNRKRNYIDNLTRNIQKSWLENFQVKSLKELINFYNPNKDATFNFHNCHSKKITSNFGMFNISAESGDISYKFKGESIESLQEISRIVYLESPIYWKLKQALQKFRIDTLLKNRRQNESILFGVPQYFYDLIDYLDKTYISNNHSDIARDLFDTIRNTIGGKLVISQQGDILFQHNDNNTNINLNATASGVVNLGIIGMLLEKQILSSKSMLFIDEPEVNLHPAWQHLILDILFKLSKSGVNIIIATHSIDMIYKLENIVNDYEGKLEKDDFIGVNYIDAMGKTTSSNLSLTEKLKFIKKDLGTPYTDLYKKNIPRLKDF